MNDHNNWCDILQSPTVKCDVGTAESYIKHIQGIKYFGYTIGKTNKKQNPKSMTCYKDESMTIYEAKCITIKIQLSKWLYALLNLFCCWQFHFKITTHDLM